MQRTARCKKGEKKVLNVCKNAIHGKKQAKTHARCTSKHSTCEKMSSEW